MRVRDWQDIVADVVEAEVEPAGWRAVGGDRARGVGEDLFLSHPAVGVYQVKTYAKHPSEVHGVGTQVARKIDDDLEPLFPEETPARFAVNTPPEDEDAAEDAARRLEQVVKAHADAPTSPEDFVDDVMRALDSPAYGPIEFDHYDRPGSLTELSNTFEEAESVLDAELEDLIEADGVGRGIQ
ncbi:MAG: hypothetical protein ABEJ57_04685 [Halobacteriaceae archaeon]